jgi:sodium/potassium/calcium exchanger 6
MTNVMLGPLLIMHMARDMVPWGYPIVDLGERTGYLPLWAAVLGTSTVGAAALFAATGYRAPPEHWDLSLGLAFVTSIVWISCAATELLECLTTLGTAVGISPAILGVTVLAWGNSVGDLVADVVIARGGQPTMAVASCYAGPLFNMVMGLGLAFSIKTAELAPAPLPLVTHPNIPLSFAFLFISLIGRGQG